MSILNLKIIESNSTHPFSNLKEEETLFKSNLESTIILRFWLNSPSVFIGKFQKEEYEVDLALAERLQVPVLRRFSGGGAVYHDEGVLNVTIVKEKELRLYSNYIIDEAKYLTKLIGESITDLIGINVSINERNGIFVCDKKIAGSSVAVSRNFLYHISILVDANLELLEKILKGKPYENGEKKFVKSVKSKVSNLKEFNKDLNVDILKEKIREDLNRKLGKND
jgi:lipoate-protein ligase A